MKKLFFLLFPSWSNPKDLKALAAADLMKQRLEGLYEATHAARISATKLNHLHHEQYLNLQEQYTSCQKRYSELLEVLFSLNSLRKVQKSDPLIAYQNYILWNSDRFVGIGKWYPNELAFMVEDCDYSGPFMRKIVANDWTMIDIKGTHLNPFL